MAYHNLYNGPEIKAVAKAIMAIDWSRFSKLPTLPEGNWYWLIGSLYTYFGHRPVSEFWDEPRRTSLRENLLGAVKALKKAKLAVSDEKDRKIIELTEILFKDIANLIEE